MNKSFLSRQSAKRYSNPIKNKLYFLILVLFHIFNFLATGSPIIVEPISVETTIEAHRPQPAHDSFPERTNNNNKADDGITAAEQNQLQLRRLYDTSVTCNDGSSIGYYVRLSANYSRNWVIYLEGGGFCGNEDSCQLRWQRTPELMSSSNWPPSRTVEGILSTEASSNPHLWNVNHVFIPYCTSDSYSGSRPSKRNINNNYKFDNYQLHQHQNNNNNNDNNNNNNNHNRSPGNMGKSMQNNNRKLSTLNFSFMGSKVIERVLESLFEDLAPQWGLYEARSVLLAGESAGATGVILNLDKARHFIERKMLLARPQRPVPQVRGLADSGWFVDNEPFEHHQQRTHVNPDQLASTDSNQNKRDDVIAYDHHDDEVANGWDCEQQMCSPVQTVRQALQLWQGQVPPSCAMSHPEQPWLCFFAYRTYQTLETPLFVVQWLYDDYQLMVDKLIPGGGGSMASIHLAQPMNDEQQAHWFYIKKVGQQVRRSLENVTALFAPSCLSHTMITKPSWNHIQVNGFRLPQILAQWEDSLAMAPDYQHTNREQSSQAATNRHRAQSAISRSEFSTEPANHPSTDQSLRWFGTRERPSTTSQTTLLLESQEPAQSLQQFNTHADSLGSFRSARQSDNHLNRVSKSGNNKKKNRQRTNQQQTSRLKLMARISNNLGFLGARSAAESQPAQQQDYVSLQQPPDASIQPLILHSLSSSQLSLYEQELEAALARELPMLQSDDSQAALAQYPGASSSNNNIQKQATNNNWSRTAHHISHSTEQQTTANDDPASPMLDSSSSLTHLPATQMLARISNGNQDQQSTQLRSNGLYLMLPREQLTSQVNYQLVNRQNAHHLSPSIITTTNNDNPMTQRSKLTFRFIDSCNWPQCNRECPTLNPYLHT